MIKKGLDVDECLETAINAVISGGKIVKSYFFNNNYKVLTKSDSSFQTTADRDSEKEIIKIIIDKYPNHCIDSEEQDKIIGNKNSIYKWIIDPLDGTDNFVLKITYFCVSVCLYKEKTPILAAVYNPITEKLYTAERGKGTKINNEIVKPNQIGRKNLESIFFIPDKDTKYQTKTLQLKEKLYRKTRRLLDTWSPTLDWCLVAEGKVDALVIIENSSVVLDAGFLILQEAGGIITDFDNNLVRTENKGYIIGSKNEIYHKALVNYLRPEL